MGNCCWIHAGGYQIGNSNLQLPDFFMDKPIVVVTPNYRLSVTGFLSTGDNCIPGNMGLKDQRLALRWVQKNIKYFNGDPTKVTLGGMGVGSASVQYHMVSPTSTGSLCNLSRLSMF
jgi:carboxylesterase type B